jgi:hypothetical protein
MVTWSDLMVATLHVSDVRILEKACVDASSARRRKLVAGAEGGCGDGGGGVIVFMVVKVSD